MIKKLLLAVMIAIPTMGFAQKFGVIDLNSIGQQMPEMKEVQTQLEASGKKYETEFNTLRTEMEKKATEFQQMEESTPDAIKQRRLQELQELDQRIQQFQQTAQQDLQRQREQLMAPIQQKLSEAVKAVGAEGNFTMIFENLMPYYVGSDVVDVTPLVKAKLGIK